MNKNMPTIGIVSCFCSSISVKGTHFLRFHKWSALQSALYGLDRRTGGTLGGGSARPVRFRRGGSAVVSAGRLGRRRSHVVDGATGRAGKAVRTQGSAHRGRFMATAGVMLFRGPQARRYTHNAVHTPCFCSFFLRSALQCTPFVKPQTNGFCFMEMGNIALSRAQTTDKSQL